MNDEWIDAACDSRERLNETLAELQTLTEREWNYLISCFHASRNRETCVVNRKKQPFDVYIGRGSRWGNPFEIGRDGSREEVCAKYLQHLLHSPELLAALSSLKGKRLGCYCSPRLCHGDIIIHVMRLKRII